MAGLLNPRGMQPQADPTMQQQPGRGAGPGSPPAGSGQQDGGDESPNVTPEEQRQYDEFMDRAYQIAYSRQSFNGILERIRGDDDKVQALADVVVNIVVYLEESAEKSGYKISQDVLFHGGEELLEDLADTMEKAGIYAYSEKEVEAAFYRAMDIYRDMAASTGNLDPNAVQSDMQAMEEADRSGQLYRDFPGLKSLAAIGQKQGDQTGGGSGQPQPQQRGGMGGGV